MRIVPTAEEHLEGLTHAVGVVARELDGAYDDILLMALLAAPEERTP